MRHLSCLKCYGTDNGNVSSMLLQGLAAATKLNLRSVREAVLCSSDLDFVSLAANIDI